MRQKIFFFLLVTVCSVHLMYAQKPDPVKVRIVYKFRFMNDTTSRTEFTENEMILMIGEKMSAYKSYSSYKIDSMYKANPGNFSGGMISAGTISIAGAPTDLSNAQYTMLAKNQLLSSNRIFVTEYLVDESAKQTQWTITGETKEIAGIACQKATGRVKGRDYAAWFAPELPYSLGPWKLNNLPGLILEASDNAGEVFFEFERMSSEASTATVELPNKATQVSLSEYLKVKAAFEADPQGFMRANAPPPPPGMSSMGNITVSGRPINPAANVKKTVFNNKLEKEN